MYVYTWKKPDGTPFYVGMGSTLYRFSPKNRGHRNKACLEILDEVGADNVLVELQPMPDAETAKEVERQAIARIGILRNGTGPLTNIARGGEFHPVTPEISNKLKALWEDPAHRAKIVAAQTGKPRKLAPSTRVALAERIKQNPEMRGWGERNGKDAAFDAKRIAGIQAAQPRRAEKMRDPEALAQRKERLRQTLNSEEHKARRAAQNTPEYRARMAEVKREYWRKKREGV